MSNKAGTNVEVDFLLSMYSFSFLILPFVTRDLGEHVRALVSKSFPQGESSKPNPEADRQIKHFANIARDAHRDANPRRFPEATSTTLDAELLKQVTDVSFLGNVAVLEEMDKPFWKRSFSQFEKEKKERSKDKQEE